MVSLGRAARDASATSVCEPEGQRTGITAGRAALAAAGLGLLVAGIWVDRDEIPVGTVLITLGGLVLLVGVALPLVSQVELGLPMLFRVSLAARERRERLHQEVEDCRGLLVASAACLCLDGDAATRAVESCVSDAAVSWHRTDDTGLRIYLLCLLVQQCRFESTTHPGLPPGTEPLLRLPLAEREVLVLVDRARLGRSTAAKMLGLTTNDVGELHDRALAALSQPGERT